MAPKPGPWHHCVHFPSPPCETFILLAPFTPPSPSLSRVFLPRDYLSLALCPLTTLPPPPLPAGHCQSPCGPRCRSGVAPHGMPLADPSACGARRGRWRGRQRRNGYPTRIGVQSIQVRRRPSAAVLHGSAACRRRSARDRAPGRDPRAPPAARRAAGRRSIPKTRRR